MVWSGILLGAGVLVLLATRGFRRAHNDTPPAVAESPKKSVAHGDVTSKRNVEN